MEAHAVIFFDKLEYQTRPIFKDRDDHVIYAWADKAQAEASAARLYRGRVVSADSLPYGQCVIYP